MQPGSSFFLVNEMLETPGLIARFDPHATHVWAEAMKGHPLLLTGEGSSRIFPAKNMIAQALRSGGKHIVTEGARQAAEYNLDGYMVLAASNSGRTKEVNSLFEKLAKESVPRYSVVATPASRLAELSTDTVTLSCGVEKAVAAGKSVVEQALFFQSLLGGREWGGQEQAAKQCDNILKQDIDARIIAVVADAHIVYFSGRNDGVAEELALKANEIARKKSMYLEGTYALHGVEEVLLQDEVVVLVEPFRDDIEKYQKVLVAGAGVNVVAISSFDTPFPTIKIPSLRGFDGYYRLLAGWNLLVSAGIAAGVNIDKPERVRKVGNEI